MQTVQDLCGHNDVADRRGFDALFSRSYRRTYSLAYRMLGNTSEAEDVTQEAYVRAWRHFSQYDHTHSFESWLFRILANLVIDRQRHGKITKILSLDTYRTVDSDGPPFSVEIPDTSANPETLLLSSEMSEEVQKALAGLPDLFRQVVLLASVRECTYEEIGEIIQCPLGTVRSRIHRGQCMLRRSLEEQYAR